MRDNGKKDIRTLVNVEDIQLPEIVGFKSPNETSEPEMQPFKIYEDDRVRVSATLVYHAPIWPAFGYRFDTDEGAVVFSGDTGPSQNLVKLAKAQISSFMKSLYRLGSTASYRRHATRRRRR
jgi:ribonuclease BN (tRNA processing enzyme)